MTELALEDVLVEDASTKLATTQPPGGNGSQGTRDNPRKLTRRASDPARNEEAEIAILGALLLDPRALHMVLDIVRPSDFCRLAHQRILDAVIALGERGEPADLITVSDELRTRGTLEACGGAAYISRLTSGIPTSANVEFYARIVQDAAQKRAFDATLRQALEENSSPTTHAAEIATRLAPGRHGELDGRPAHAECLLQDPPV